MQLSLTIATAYSGHGHPSEKHDTMTCFQQNVQFRIRNLRMPQVTDLRQERDVFII